MIICKEKNCFGNSCTPGTKCSVLDEVAVDKNGSCKFKKKYREFKKDYIPTEEELQKIRKNPKKTPLF